MITISATGKHTCALLRGGAVKCWGDNEEGQLGNGAHETESIPVPVKGLQRGVVAISAGGLFTCALLRGGAVKCWGLNEYGQLGNATTKNSSTPDAVKTLRGIATISGGDEYTCALMDTGAVACWGHNGVGELGDGTNRDSLTPAPVRGL